MSGQLIQNDRHAIIQSFALQIGFLHFLDYPRRKHVSIL